MTHNKSFDENNNTKIKRFLVENLKNLAIFRQSLFRFMFDFFLFKLLGELIVSHLEL